jgi:hypothetical protein
MLSPEQEREEQMKRKVVFLFINGSITEPRMEMDLGQGLMIMVESEAMIWLVRGEEAGGRGRHPD